MAASPGAVDYGDLLAHLEPVVREAGALILQVYAGNFTVRGKADASLVTEADEQESGSGGSQPVSGQEIGELGHDLFSLLRLGQSVLVHCA